MANMWLDKCWPFKQEALYVFTCGTIGDQCLTSIVVVLKGKFATEVKKPDKPKNCLMTFDLRGNIRIINTIQ